MTEILGAPLEGLRPQRVKKPAECDVDLEMGDSEKEMDCGDFESTDGTLTDFEKELEKEEEEEEKGKSEHTNGQVIFIWSHVKHFRRGPLSACTPSLAPPPSPSKMGCPALAHAQAE